MTENSTKTEFVTIKIWLKSANKIAKKKRETGLSIAELVDDMVQRSEGFETRHGIKLPPRRAIHEPSRQAGRSEGYSEALADLAEKYHNPQHACALALTAMIDFSQACEWDLRVLRECGFDAPWGTLQRDSKRAPKL